MSRQSTYALPAPVSRAWLYIFAGFAASLASIGLARFAYAPLVPALIQAHWFSSSSVVFLSAANLTGYLIGALIGQPLARRFSNPPVLRAMMVLVTLAFLACGYPLSLSWFFTWRLLSGIAGGAIMVLVAATVLPHVALARRGLAGGAIFLGVGVGIAGSGTVVPWLLAMGLQTTWSGLAAISAALTLLTWYAWPQAQARGAVQISPRTPGVATGELRGASMGRTAGRAVGNVTDSRTGSVVRQSPDHRAGLFLLFGQYGLMAVALVPAMVFLVDFVERGLGAGSAAGAHFWVLYGLGAMMGPPLYGWLGDSLGPRPALRAVLAVQAVAMSVLSLASGHAALAVATVVIGTFPPGIVPLALARVHSLIPHDALAQNRAWSRATVSFATFQALAGYAYSAVFSASGGHHRTMFVIATVALVGAVLGELGVVETAIGRVMSSRLQRAA